jgi:hypothetical protein
VIRCSEASLTAAEPMAGTAPHATGWLAIEHRRRWGRDPLRDSGLDADVAETLAAAAAALPLQVLLIRAPAGDAADRPLTVLAAGMDDAGAWLQRTTVADPASLLDLDLTALAAGRRPGWTDSVEPVLLVCSHSQRDRCCAVAGRPLAAAMSPVVETWECSHLGGHRFAPTAVILPTGLVLGRSSAADLRAALAGKPRPGSMRGFARLTPPAQAAEVAARAAGADGGGQPLLLRDEEDSTAANESAFLVTDRGGVTWRATVSTATTPRVLSCGAVAAETVSRRSTATRTD